ncbi:hypothetical protein L0128_04295 [candidate division KSB1 bacterium]|nr:hypothetical protein [candidate division KSB1 bacterium]
MGKLKSKSGFKASQLGYLALGLLGWWTTTAWSQGAWEDGKPLFQKLAQMRNVVVDSSVQLASSRGQAQESASFRFILNGIDWKWPLNNSVVGQPAAADIDYRNSQGRNFYVVTDGDGHRVIEINPIGPDNVWEFNYPIESDKYLKFPISTYPYDENSKTKYLITDKLRHRVLKVDRESKDVTVIYGNETPGDGFNQLNHPSDALHIPNSSQALICDQGNNRVLIINEDSGDIDWEWGREVGQSLKVPVDIEYISTTNEILVTDQQNHRVIVIDRANRNITFQFGTGAPDSANRGLANPTDADYLPNNHIMICDSSNQRLIEVNRNGQIVWQFHRRLKGLTDADRLPDNRILVIADSTGLVHWPFRLGYTSTEQTSSVHDLARNVLFDSIFITSKFKADTTAVRIQLRTANETQDISSMPWYGPTGQFDFYTAASQRINPVHDGARKYQFRAFLDTNSPLFTPELNNVRVTYHFFNADSVGTVTSGQIADLPNVIVTSWDSLFFNTKIPLDPAQRNNVQIEMHVLDPLRDVDLLDPIKVNPLVEKHGVRLSGTTGWKGQNLQAVRLKATLRTANSAVTPILRDWRITWQTIQATPSRIDFVNGNLQPVQYYRISNRIDETDPDFFKYVDLVWVRLMDSNLAANYENLKLVISVKHGLDSVLVDLTREPSGEFINQIGIKALVSRFPDPNDKTLQVNDRDTLVITYRDPLDAEDVSTATVVMIQNTAAQIQIENRRFAKIDSAAIDDTIHVRVFGEQDQNLTPKQDTILVLVTDNQTQDLEEIQLVEIADTLGVFNTGIFLTTRGLVLSKAGAATPGDGRIQTLPNHRVGASYQDNSKAVVASIIIRSQPDSNIKPYAGSYDFTVAPNPFYVGQHTRLRLRAVSGIGDLRLRKIEIFNLAGEKVRVIDGQSIFTTLLLEDQIGFADNWWDLMNSDGQPVSSGTYWFKFSASLVNQSEGSLQTISVLRKFVLIR